MQFVYYTIAALLLYVLSDWILVRMETFHGDRFKYRSLVFFGLVMILAVSSFKVIEILTTR
jgi:hypothetical protein